jgi:hypothetical protein
VRRVSFSGGWKLAEDRKLKTDKKEEKVGLQNLLPVRQFLITFKVHMT